MDLRQEAARGIAWTAAQNWGTRVVSLLVLLVLARLLEPKVFGLVAMASVFTALVRIFVDQGFGDAIVQRAKLEPGHLDTAFWIGIVSGVLLTLGGVAASGLVADLFDEPELAPIVGWLSLSFVIVALSSTQRAILRRQLAFKSLAARTLVGAIAGGIVAVTMAFMGLGVWRLVAQSLVGGIVATVVLWRVSDWRPGFGVSTRHFRELFGFSINILGSKLLNFFNRHTDDLLIGFFLGPIALGYYTIAYSLLRVMTGLLTNTVSSVAFPVFSRLQDNAEKMRRGFYQATRYTSLISIPAFIGISIVASEFVPAVYGPNWMPSIPVMQVLAFIGILHSVFYFNTAVIVAAGRPTWRLGLVLMNAVSNVIAFAIAVRWGIVAVALAYVIRGYLLSPVALLAVRHLIRIDPKTYLRQYVPPVIASLAMVALVSALKYVLKDEPGAHWQLALYVIAGGLAYLVTLRLIAPSVFPEMAKLVRLALPSLKLRGA